VPWRSEAFKKIYNFRRASVVDVPIAKVDHTLVSWLRWMASSYVGQLDTKTTSLRSACHKYLGRSIPQYVYGSANLVGRPGLMAFRGRCALVALPACFGHQGFYVGNEGLPVGCAPNGPAKRFWVLKHCRLETFLRSACLEWLCQTPCNHAGYLGVSTLHTFKINGFLATSSTKPDIATSTTTSLMTSSVDTSFKTLRVSSDTGHC
jgi:hypothetical protein